MHAWTCRRFECMMHDSELERMGTRLTLGFERHAFVRAGAAPQGQCDGSVASGGVAIGEAMRYRSSNLGRASLCRSRQRRHVGRRQAQRLHCGMRGTVRATGWRRRRTRQGMAPQRHAPLRGE